MQVLIFKRFVKIQCSINILCHIYQESGLSSTPYLPRMGTVKSLVQFRWRVARRAVGEQNLISAN